MKVRLLTSRVGTKFSQNRGDEVDVSDAEAVRMIEAGQAEAIRVAKPETAVRAAPKAERAVK